MRGAVQAAAELRFEFSLSSFPNTYSRADHTLTCDLTNRAEHVQLLRVQSFNVVVDVPEKERRDK